MCICEYRGRAIFVTNARIDPAGSLVEKNERALDLLYSGCTFPTLARQEGGLSEDLRESFGSCESSAESGTSKEDWRGEERR